MKPIGPLMSEHRLIERMVKLLDAQFKAMNETNKVDAAFLMVAVDFFRTYADKTHHGKEEEILFRELAKKDISPAHRLTMQELEEEHRLARGMVTRIVIAREKFVHGEKEAINQVMFSVKEVVKFYPGHIAKEDKQFFYPAMDYFSEAEQNAILAEFWEFDRKLIHEKYQNIVDDIESKRGNASIS